MTSSRRRASVFASTLAAFALATTTLLNAAEYRLAHGSTGDSPLGQAATRLADALRERTKGEIDITVFPDGQLGGELDVGRDLGRGVLDFGLFTQGVLSGLQPALGINNLPYMVTTFKEADAIYYGDGYLAKLNTELLVPLGVRPIGWYEIEFRAISNSVRKIEKLEDLRNLKLRVPQVPVMRAVLKEAGAQTVTIPFPELFTALQQGVVDGQDNGPILTYTSKLYETQKYLSLTNHSYGSGVIAISERLWKSLTPELQEIVAEVGKEVGMWQVELNRRSYDNYVDLIRQAGIEVNTISEAEMKRFQEYGLGLWSAWSEEFGAARIEGLREALAKVD